MEYRPGGRPALATWTLAAVVAGGLALGREGGGMGTQPSTIKSLIDMNEIPKERLAITLCTHLSYVGVTTA